MLSYIIRNLHTDIPHVEVNLIVIKMQKSRPKEVK